jgi:hypothetical protein
MKSISGYSTKPSKNNGFCFQMPSTVLNCMTAAEGFSRPKRLMGLLRASSLSLQNAVLEILVNWPVYFLSYAFVID